MVGDIKQKFDPSSHATRCGKPWRWLDIKGRNNLMAVDKGRSEILLFIDFSGKAVNVVGAPQSIEAYDLIPITHRPVDLPTNLRKEIKYAAWSSSLSDWAGYSSKPIKRGAGFNQVQCFKFWQLDCFSIPEDPAGPENSLHIRTKNGWERCSE